MDDESGESMEPMEEVPLKCLEMRSFIMPYATAINNCMPFDCNNVYYSYLTVKWLLFIIHGCRDYAQFCVYILTFFNGFCVNKMLERNSVFSRSYSLYDFRIIIYHAQLTALLSALLLLPLSVLHMKEVVL